MFVFHTLLSPTFYRLPAYDWIPFYAAAGCVLQRVLSAQLVPPPCCSLSHRVVVVRGGWGRVCGCRALGRRSCRDGRGFFREGCVQVFMLPGGKGSPQSVQFWRASLATLSYTHLHSCRLTGCWSLVMRPGGGASSPLFWPAFVLCPTHCRGEAL